VRNITIRPGRPVIFTESKNAESGTERGYGIATTYDDEQRSMMDSRDRIFGKLLGLSALALVVGCTSSTEADGFGSVRFTFQQQAPPAILLSAGLDEAGWNVEGVDVGLVSSLEITIADIMVLPVNEDAGDDESPAWVPVGLTEPVTLDLRSLPSEEDTPLIIASGQLPIGDYGNVRLMVSAAEVEFTEAITVGQHTFDATPTAHTVEIPSVENSGLKTNLRFSVSGDDSGAAVDVGLVFDPEATFLHVVTTGSGKVMLTPVIRGAAPQPQA
jgi:hypothetical protein